MSKYLIVVESPAKANTIAKYLGKDYKVIASMGHLVDLPKTTLGVDVEKDFVPKYQTIKGKAQLIKELKQEAENSKKVYLATDPDREGEAISWHISNILNIDENDNCRITFNEITKNAVTEAVKNPRIIDKDLVDAQQARRILDRIVGYKLSPLLWKKIKKGLSAGRVQSVATRIICDKEEEINSFVSKEYWTIFSDLKTDKNKKFTVKLALKDGEKIEISNEKEAMSIKEELKNLPHIVSEIKKSKKQRKPSPPFTTSTLQQEASRKLGFTSKKTMMNAQVLYEGVNVKGRGQVGLITYMRTDSLRVSTEAMISAKNFISEKFGNEYLPKSFNVYKTKKGNVQDAHEAIRPSFVELTPETVRESLNNDQYKLYKLIWERFVASQMTSALLDVVSIDVNAGSYTLKTGGSTVTFDGFTRLYVEGTDDNQNEEDQKLPELKREDKLILLDVNEKQNFTAPPLRYTEATLIKTMEEYGIGRPSTYAPTISTILQREYIVKEGKSLVPTELGVITTNLMKDNFKDIVDVKFTANLEEKLDSIEDGKINWVKILREFYDEFADVLNKAQGIEKVKIKDEETDVKCEKCGRNMVIKSGRFGKFLACPGFPECKNAKPLTVEVKEVLCPICNSKILQKKSKKGKIYYGCEKNPECSFMTWDEPTNKKCEKCGSVMAKKRYGRGSKLYCINKDCENTLKYPAKKTTKNNTKKEEK